MADAVETTGAGTEETKGTENTAGAGTENEDDKNESSLSPEALDKLVQSRADKATAALSKENAKLKKALEKAKREKLSDDEIRNLELSDKEKELAEKEKELAERENRLFAIKAIKDNGLDDGSELSLEIVDFVLADNEETIESRVKTFKTLVDKLVAAKVDDTFKANGRLPKGSAKATETEDKDTSVAQQLGKSAAARDKESQKILDYYTGGKK